MRALVLLALVGCKAAVVNEACVLEDVELESATQTAAWLAPDGTLFTGGWGSQPRVRAPDGTWSLDPVGSVEWIDHLDGVDANDVWAINWDTVYRRQGGTWSEVHTAPDGVEFVGLHVNAADDVWVLGTDPVDCLDCYSDDTPHRFHWDGSAWTTEVMDPIGGPIYGFAVTEDGTQLVTTGAVMRLGTPHVSIPTPVGSHLRDVAVAADGTVVAWSESHVASGTVDGLVEVEFDGWAVDVHVGAADDLVLASVQYDPSGFGATSDVSTWDGQDWTVIAGDVPADDLVLAVGPNEVFAVGDTDHEVVFSGDRSGLTLERRTHALQEINTLAVDDVTGHGWASGFGWIAAVDLGNGWEPVPLPNRSFRMERIAATDGRIALEGYDAIAVYADDELDVTEIVDGTVHGLIGAGGVFWAGLQFFDPWEAVIWRHDGNGWEEVTDAPSGTFLAGYAEAADAVWIALDGENGYELVHYDGQSWNSLTPIPRGPSQIGRLPDGDLFVTVFEGVGQFVPTVHAFRNGALEPLTDYPTDVMQAGHGADGSTFVARSVDTPDSYDVPILRRAPGGPFVPVATEFRNANVVNSESTVWMGYGRRSVTHRCKVP